MQGITQKEVKFLFPKNHDSHPSPQRDKKNRELGFSNSHHEKRRERKEHRSTRFKNVGNFFGREQQFLFGFATYGGAFICPRSVDRLQKKKYGKGMDADSELRMKEGGYKVSGKDSEGEEEENAFASCLRETIASGATRIGSSQGDPFPRLFV